MITGQRRGGDKLLGSRVRYYRQARDLTQAELARAVGAHQSFISQIEKGERKPSTFKLRAIAHALDVTAAELLADGERASVPDDVAANTPDLLAIGVDDRQLVWDLLHAIRKRRHAVSALAATEGETQENGANTLENKAHIISSQGLGRVSTFFPGPPISMAGDC